MKKKWIKFVGKTTAKYTQGTAYELDEAIADTLIDAGQAEATEAPAEVKSVEEQVAEGIDQRIADAVAKGFEAIKKEIAPKGGHPKINPKSEDEIDIRVVASQAKRYGSLKNFANTPEGLESAYRFGMFMLGVNGQRGAIEKCGRMGIKFIGSRDIDTKTQRENSNISSGFLIPDEFQNDLIDLREKFGVFRQNAKIVPMASDSRSDPRRVNGVTAYFVGESTAASLSDKQWDRVRLTAKKLMVLTKYSNELNEDAVLNVADDLAGEIAYAFALKEDQCGFIGTGTSAYGNITGVCQALLNVDPTGTNNPANVQGLVVGTGTGYGTAYNFVLSDFNRLVATLPEYADVPGEAKFYCSKFFWGSVIQKLATAAGGNRVADIEGGALRKSFLGYDVVISQVMPKVSATNQVACLFGNLKLGARLGTRRDTTIQMSESALNAFEQDEIVIRGTERFDIAVNDVGDPTASAGPAKSAQAGNVAGPIVGLVTGAS